MPDSLVKLPKIILNLNERGSKFIILMGQQYPLFKLTANAGNRRDQQLQRLHGFQNVKKCYFLS